jgi:hypothetical protein
MPDISKSERKKLNAKKLREKKKAESALDQFYYHEAVDRTYMAGDIVERMLDHPVFEKHKKLDNKVKKALDILAEVYQELGRMEFEMFDKDKAADSQ